MINPLRPIGSAFLAFLATAGRLTLFLVNAVSHCVRPPFYGRQLSRQLIEIGFFTLPVVGLTAIFAGMVLALQSYTGFARFSAEGAIANVVVLSITRELGPVLAGLMIAGRIGAAMAAEIGTMRVTEQVDALTTLSTNPMKYLALGPFPIKQLRQSPKKRQPPHWEVQLSDSGNLPTCTAPQRSLAEYRFRSKSSIMTFMVMMEYRAFPPQQML